MLLTRLLAALPGAAITGDVSGPVAALAADSRDVVPDALFVAIRGEAHDGHAFVAQAVAAGARVVVVERDIDVAPAVRVLVPDARVALSKLAAVFYGDPSHALSVAGITGTNGKTTTTQLAAGILEACGLPCGQIGTLGSTFAGIHAEARNTTPLPIELQSMLASFRDRGAKAVTMEVSSHALALHRVDDVRFAVGAFTNLTRDHLDFHETLEAYAAAKRTLLERAAIAVIGVDDPLGSRWADELRGAGSHVLTYAIDAPADVHARDLTLRGDGSTFAVDETRVELPLPGRFNVQNALCALGIAWALGCDRAVAARSLANAAPVSGRMERFVRDGVVAIVDYAHTPDALENVLRAARETTKGRLTVVFGCGGDRDKGKRPQMGRIAAGLADDVYVTNDNPRSENPEAIARSILVTAPEATVELDRAAAIRRAVAAARPGDVVVVAGKGHEPYQIVGTERFPFDDRAEVRAALAARPAQVEA